MGIARTTTFTCDGCASSQVAPTGPNGTSYPNRWTRHTVNNGAGLGEMDLCGQCGDRLLAAVSTIIRIEDPRGLRVMLNIQKVG